MSDVTESMRFLRDLMEFKKAIGPDHETVLWHLYLIVTRDLATLAKAYICELGRGMISDQKDIHLERAKFDLTLRADPTNTLSMIQSAIESILVEDKRKRAGKSATDQQKPPGK